jgi:hypothetical protein
MVWPVCGVALAQADLPSGSAGRAGSGRPTTTGMATRGRIDGTVTQGPAVPGDAEIRAEDPVVDKKIKSICKGC